MKKILLSCAMVMAIAGADAQVLFSEDFDGIGGPTAGGAGTYSFPAGWLLRNVDNGTPAGAVSYVNEAWERREDLASNVTDSAAFSTSWYSPAGTADDWMWTPMIGPLPANTVLTWNAVTYDNLYPDGYEVRIMTQSSTPGGPTGGTGVLGNQVTNSTQIFTIAAENSTWTSHSVNLNVYTGESVWIAFRNNSNDKFLLLIDDVKAEVQLNYDAQIASGSLLSQYTEVPMNQTSSFPLAATVQNNGISPVTNVVLTANVYNQANSLVHTSTSATLATLAAGASSLQSVAAPFVPSATDNYRIEYSVSIAETDQVPANNTLVSDSIMITDTVYARDRGAVVGTIGIGAGVTGYVGSEFIITDTTKLSSVSVFLNGQSAGSKVGVQIFDYVNNVPGTTVIYTDIDSLTSTATGWYTFMLNAGPITLLPDTYIVSAIEVDSTLKVGQTTDKFFNGKFWVNWAGSPFGGWANIEAFGAQFSKAYMIRANLHDKCFNKQQITAVALDGSLCPSGTDTIIASGTVNYMWDSGSPNDTLIVSPTSTTTYTVIGSDALMCYDTATVNIVVNALPTVNAVASTDTICAGEPVTLTGSGAVTYVWTGGVADGVVFNPSLTQTYTVTGTDANGCADTGAVNIVVNGLPTVNAIASTDTICDGEPVTLTGTGAVSYTWTGGVADGVSFNPSLTQTYTVTGTDVNGCMDTSSVEVVVNACLTVEDFLNSTRIIVAYPNPNNGTFVVESRQTVTIIVYNALGDEVSRNMLNTGKLMIDLSGQESGIYFVKALTAEGEQQLIKIVKE